MSVRALRLHWILCLVAVVVVSADEMPRVSIDVEGRLTISSLPPLLSDADIKRHLDSGLTTSFVFQVRPQRPLTPGAARVDIRLELWDEVYLVTVLDGEGGLSTSEQPSAAALADWWSETGIVVTPSAPARAGLGSEVRVSLAVLPFSQAELVDTQRWLTESISQARGGARAGREGGASRTVGALIATSMQRQAVRSIVWSVPVQGHDER